MSEGSHYREAIPWPEKPVYQISLEGVKVALTNDGRVWGWTKGYGQPEEVLRFAFDDTGNPWIPRHRNFNSLVKQAFREGDFDRFLKFRERRKLRQQNMREAAEDLYQALDQAITSMLDSGYQVNHSLIRNARAAMAKARGERQ